MGPIPKQGHPLNVPPGVYSCLPVVVGDEQKSLGLFEGETSVLLMVDLVGRYTPCPSARAVRGWVCYLEDLTMTTFIKFLLMMFILYVEKKLVVRVEPQVISGGQFVAGVARFHRTRVLVEISDKACDTFRKKVLVLMHELYHVAQEATRSDIPFELAVPVNSNEVVAWVIEAGYRKEEQQSEYFAELFARQVDMMLFGTKNLPY